MASDAATGVDWDDWLQRWERMQAVHVHDRAGRTAALAEACGLAAPSGRLRILELGCGPGGVLAALARHHPAAELVGVDHDPLLLAIARETAGRRPGTILVDTDLRRPDWVEGVEAVLGCSASGGFDAVVSSTALHWLESGPLGRVYAEAHRLLRPGGVLLNADTLPFGEARLDALAETQRRHAETAEDGAEAWDAWWAAAAAAPGLSALHEERSRRFPPTGHAHGHGLTFDDHARLLGAAGFVRVERVWAWFDVAVLCALR